MKCFIKYCPTVRIYKEAINWQL